MSIETPLPHSEADQGADAAGAGAAWVPPYLCPTCAQGELAGTARGLACGSCGALVPVERGIPRFVPPENYADSFGFQWTRHARTQLDSLTGQPISERRLFGVTEWPRDLSGELILEAGCGAGRFTEVLLGTGAHVVAFDYSVAVDANFRNNGANARLQLMQADIFRIPFRPGQFDKVLCLGVLQHTPDPEQAFRSLCRQVRPGGSIVVDVYNGALWARMQWKYLLRPIAKRMDRERLYALVSSGVDRLLPLAGWLRRVAGRAGARLVPIVEYSHLGLPPELNREWAVLDTFDMYSPTHDHPQTVRKVRRWFESEGLEDVQVGRGPYGVVGRGRRSAR